MSTRENEIWLEQKQELFRELLQDKETWDECESIIRELKENNFTYEALDLEKELDQEVELKNAWEKGSEAGMDALQDK